MAKVLTAWIGGNDLYGIKPDARGPGPIAATLAKLQATENFDRLELLYNYEKSDVAPYLDWLKAKVDLPIKARYADLTSPIHFGDIYQHTNTLLTELADDDLHILLSPGTPAMQAVWILLSKTRFPATYWQSSPEAGVQQAEIPFDIAAEYLPSIESLPSVDRFGADTLAKLASLNAPESAAFDDIITRNPHMLELKRQAAILAERTVPVLIYGESGTGKELFARAIHNASPRASKPFVALNCGAFPGELIDSILFGHKKGAFTGATADKPGVFDDAHGGTLFLDEFGELEPAVQVRLLRVLQEGRFTPVGGRDEISVDVRIVAATNKDLLVEVAEGRFREDLFYRIAVGVLHLPPLREREGDLSLLVESLMAALAESDSHLKDKKISVSGKNLILNNPWRGNMRELQSTLMRAALWSQGDTIEVEDIQQALFQMPEKNTDLLGRDISQGLDVQGLCDDVMRHYIPRALEAAQGKKKAAAELLGFKSYQTLGNQIEKLGLKSR